MASARSSARSVGLTPSPLRTKRSSPNNARRWPSRLLIAGWLKPIRSAALVTLPSVSIASKATRRFKSIAARFTCVAHIPYRNRGILYIYLPHVESARDPQSGLAKHGDLDASDHR